MDGVPGGVISLSEELRILSANRAMGALVGRAPARLIGEPLDVLLSAPSRILFQTHVYPALKADGRVEEVFLTLTSGDGETTPVLLNALRADGEEADGASYHGLLVRIRARSRWEAELLAATRAIERERAASERLAVDLRAAADDLAARYAEEQRNHEFRDAFIGVISHELRTPITTIYGMSHILRQRHEAWHPATVRQHLDDIATESDRLRRLTEDLLVLSRAEGGRLLLATEPIVIRHVLETTLESERSRAHDHDFTLRLSPGLPLVLGEDVYVEQVVRNYLTNAVKYSPPGTTVEVAVRREGDGVAVRVTDGGLGLPEDSADRLFELFYRAPQAVRQTSGAGIGLFVCRQLIEAMGGRVWAAPASPPPGAEFGFWLPAIAEGGDED